VGFEPTIPLRVYKLSRLARSATLTPLRFNRFGIAKVTKKIRFPENVNQKSAKPENVAQGLASQSLLISKAREPEKVAGAVSASVLAVDLFLNFLLLEACPERACGERLSNHRRMKDKK
jgi:hypothetical protein